MKWKGIFLKIFYTFLHINMNLLAHAYLSFNNESILVGNMISDYVKGKKQFDYPLPIQAGIQLHRAIDAFTDTHDATQKIKNLFKPTYRLYAGAFTDVVYDYFLANDENEFPSAESLRSFTKHTYKLLQNNNVYFPEKFAQSFPHMQAQDWLYHYRYDDGMQKSFGGLAKRAKYITETHTAFNTFLNNKELIRQAYQIFFPQLKVFTTNKMEQLLQ
jgi:acyl carrier protein phosphodiesterase